MELYYQDDVTAIYCGDSREAPEDWRFDLLLTDPPYGVFTENGGTGEWMRYGDRVYAKDAAPGPEEILAHAGRCREAIVWGANYVGGLPGTPSWLVWDKREGDTGFTSEATLAWTTMDCGRIRMFRHYKDRGGPKLWPGALPEPLVAWSISLADSPEFVFDPFMGSGTTLRVAKDHGIRSVGIDLSERACEIAANRLSQGALFV